MTESGFTAEQFETWIPAREAYHRANSFFGASPAAYSILDRLRRGLLVARAKHVFIEPKNEKRGFDFELPAIFWKSLLDSSIYHELPQLTLWNSGALRIDLIVGGQPVSLNLYDVRFEPEAFLDMLPAQSKLAPRPVINVSQPRPEQNKAPKNDGKGGRPRKDFWDPLWAFIAGQLYSGDLKPDKQATVEQAMLDWAAKHGHDLSEPSARTRARMLMAAIREENKN